MLLDVEVARQPGEVVPVSHLIQHVGPVGLARLGPAAAAVVVGEERRHLADRPVVDAPDASRKPLSYRRQRPDTTDSPFFLASSQLASTDWTPGASTATGFSANTCLPASTASRRCCGRKCGGVQSKHDVDTTIQELAVGIEADETMVGLDVQFGGDLLVFPQDIQALF